MLYSDHVSLSSHHILIDEFPMELRPDIVIHITLLLIHPLGLVLKHCILIPPLRETEPSL